MSLFEIISTILVGPLKLLFEVVYVITYRFIGDPGLSIVVLSLAMNFLVLPLYRRADAMQEEARDIENKLHKGVSHIKKVFSGDEQVMILQTYYRQNDYRPGDALRGSVSLLLEIPFFIAAYQFLSNLELLTGVSFGPIADLSAPDGLLTFNGVTINLLPIVMTLINLMSSAIFLKGHPTKTKVQLYAMALFFLVFLYTSPAGLVFYWTLNNLFSLCKTLLYKLKNSRKVVMVLFSVFGVVFLLVALFCDLGGHNKVRIGFALLGTVMQFPLLFKERRASSLGSVELYPEDKKTVILCEVFLTVLVGALIPSTYIAASPQEFVDFGYYINPLWYVVYAMCMAIGFFVFWFGVFYQLMGSKNKKVFGRCLCVASVVAIVDYMFFGTQLGIISWTLQYENGLYFPIQERLLNLTLIVVIAIMVSLLVSKSTKTLQAFFLVSIVAFVAMVTTNIYKINDSLKRIDVYATAESYADIPKFELSRTGKNVVVLMMDRALGELVPFIMEEKPELEEKFDGFTYYANTISHGRCTNFGTPGLFGGYEYTPVEMNKRDTEQLVDKHNEALKVMPVLFAKNDYKVTLFDPTYAGYQLIPDTSVFDEYTDIEVYTTEKKFLNVEISEKRVSDTKRNMFCFSVMKITPVVLQRFIYSDGNYNQADNRLYSTSQTIMDSSTAYGKDPTATKNYNALKSLPELSEITDKRENTFLMMTNDLTHSMALFQKPNYTLEEYVDNSAFDKDNSTTTNGIKLHVDTVDKTARYHVNMAMFLQVGNWLDYLRENDVYDNTRIIIVADHGYSFGMIEELDFSDLDYANAENYYPLLLVKDFDSKGFTTSYEFMTNADVPTLATSGAIDNPMNPFTGKAINSNEKIAHDQMIIMSNDFDLLKNNGNTFLPAYWASVHDDLWDMDNWNVSTEKLVLKEHALP